MRSVDLPRSVPRTGLLVVLVALSGLVLAWLINSAPTFWALAAVGAVLFLIIFLHRPDLGLMLALLVRSFTDLSLSRGVEALGSTPGRILASPLNAGLVLILIFAGGLFLLRRGAPLLRLPGGTSLVLMLLVGLVGLARAVSLVHSESFLYGMDFWLRAVSALVVYALAAYVFQRPQRVQGVIDVMAASFAIPAGVAFYQLATGNIPAGTFVDRNAFGTFLVLIFGVFLCQGLVHSGMRKILAWSIVAASGVLLVATFSRTSWVGTMIVLLVVGALRKRVFLILAPVAAIIVVGMVPSVAHRLSDPFGGSFADRVHIWQMTAPEWMSATHDDASAVSTVVNRLAGTGPGSVEFLVARGYGFANMEHDDYLTILYEYGFVGLGAYLSAYLAILIFSYRTWRLGIGERMASVALSFIAVTLGFMVMSLTNNVFGLTQNQMYFWALAGLTAASARMTVRAEGNLSANRSANMQPTWNGRTPLVAPRYRGDRRIHGHEPQ